jgi:hypothetical protein
VFARLTTLHLFNGTIELGKNSLPFLPVRLLSTIRLTDVRLVAARALESELLSMADGTVLLGVSQPTTSLILEDCTFEAAFDTPA